MIAPRALVEALDKYKPWHQRLLAGAPPLLETSVHRPVVADVEQGRRIYAWHNRWGGLKPSATNFVALMQVERGNMLWLERSERGFLCGCRQLHP